MPSPLNFKLPLVLASKSPRRKYLLETLGIPLIIEPSHAPEVIVPGTAPAAVVQDLARLKARDVADRQPNALVLGADTIVVLDEEILGKPTDEADARAMLAKLSGRSHTVFTGIALVHLPSGRVKSVSAETVVSFGILSAREIVRYVAGGSPMDKAGAYGIQDDAGALFIEGIQGDYNNVVGLPLRTLYVLLQEEFRDLLVA